MTRIARITAIGYPHHITQRGNNREPVFFDDEDRTAYLKILGTYSKKWHFDIWSYCLMANHVHILAVPKQVESLAKGIGGTNLVYTQYINRRYDRSGRLWQNRFFSTIVEKDTYLWAVARYVERNPLRADLVQRAEEYKWSSCRAHIKGDHDNLLSGSWLDEEQLKAYRAFFSQEENEVEEAIRRATSTGRPLGQGAFIKKLGEKISRELFPKKAGRPRKKEKE